MRVVDLDIGASKSDICAVRVVTISERAGRTRACNPGARPGRRGWSHGPAVEVFKRNAIDVERLNADQAAVKKRSERDRIELLDGMASQFESTVSAVLATVTQPGSKMGDRAETMAGKMVAADQSTCKVMQATNSTSDNVQTVAAAAEELSASINEISSRVSATIAVDTSNAAEKTSSTIAELSEQAQKIGSIISLIHNIAS